MEKILTFINENIEWFLVVIALIIITIIGFLADKKKSNEKKEIKEVVPKNVEVPTFVHDGVITPPENNNQENLTQNDSQPQSTMQPEMMRNDNQTPNGMQSEMMVNNNMNVNTNPVNDAIMANNPQQKILNNQPKFSHSSVGPMSMANPTPMQNAPMMDNYQMPPQRQNNNMQPNMMNNQNGYMSNPVSQQPVVNSQPINNMKPYQGQAYGMNTNQYNNPQPQMSTGNFNNQSMMQPQMQNLNYSQNVMQPRENVTIPTPVNMQPIQPQVMPQPVNSTPIHEPIKAQPIPGMVGAPVSFVNGPKNPNVNNNN